jgi:hypothetical protein
MCVFRYLIEEVLWGLRNDEFEKQALLGRKHPCNKCGAKKKYYCEKCTEVVGDPSVIPSVRLPIEIAVIRDERENKAKSTATHAALVSPEINIFTYPHLPLDLVGDDDASAEQNVLLFPSDTSIEVEALDWSNVKVLQSYIHMFVCIHKNICMHIYIHIYMYACMYIFVYICMYIYIYMKIHIYIYIHTYPYAYTVRRGYRLDLDHLQPNVTVYIYTCNCLYIYILIMYNIHTYIQMYICIHTYIHIYI